MPNPPKPLSLLSWTLEKLEKWQASKPSWKTWKPPWPRWLPLYSWKRGLFGSQSRGSCVFPASIMTRSQSIVRHEAHFAKRTPRSSAWRRSKPPLPLFLPHSPAHQLTSTCPKSNRHHQSKGNSNAVLGSFFEGTDVLKGLPFLNVLRQMISSLFRSRHEWVCKEVYM